MCDRYRAAESTDGFGEMHFFALIPSLATWTSDALSQSSDSIGQLKSPPVSLRRAGVFSHLRGMATAHLPIFAVSGFGYGGRNGGCEISSFAKSLKKLVGVARFELATPSSRTRCATRLRYTPAALREPSYRLGPGGRQADKFWRPRRPNRTLRGPRPPYIRGADRRRRAATIRPQMGRGQEVKASGFDPVIPGSNPGAPAKSRFSTNCRRFLLLSGQRRH